MPALLVLKQWNWVGLVAVPGVIVMSIVSLWWIITGVKGIVAAHGPSQPHRSTERAALSFLKRRGRKREPVQ
jgi:hypothetical protein